MRKYLLPSAICLLLGLGFAFAQSITKALQLSPDTTGAFSVDSNSGVYFPGHVLVGPGTLRPAPVLSACITGGTPSITGTDFAGSFTAGTTASTSCVVTFGTAWLTAPNCLVSYAAGGPPATSSWTTSTTALTITQASTASVKVSWLCTSAS
jgi:hypothetical protein